MCSSCICFIIVIIVVAPEIIIPPFNTIVINGSVTVLNCTAVGDPLPYINWFISGVNISSLLSNGLIIPFDQQGRINDMIVDNTVINDTTLYSSLEFMETTLFITGDYTCRASNILGVVSTTATLTVHGM